MLYRERPQMEKMRNTTTVETSSNEIEYNDDFVECLKNALKIMEAKQ